MTDLPCFRVTKVDDWLRISRPGDSMPHVWLPKWACDDTRFTPLERNFLYVGFRLCVGPDPPRDALFIGSARRLSQRFGLSVALFRLIRDRLITKGVLVVDPIGHGLDAHHLVGPPCP